jgi:predicted transcriptional regulator
MKILFLDIDGVLNSDSWYKTEKWKLLYKKYGVDQADFDPKLVQKLNLIVQSTDCEIVISSAWRLTFSIEEIKNFLTNSGFLYRDKMFDKTPSLMYKKYSSNKIYNEINPRIEGRGSEIDAWLREHKEIESFVIVDDNSDMKPHMDKLVKTSIRHGLQDKDVEQIIKILEKQDEISQ